MGSAGLAGRAGPAVGRDLLRSVRVLSKTTGRRGRSNGDAFLKFETLTQCPIDTRLVEQSLLSELERRWLNAYHRGVYKTLRPLLDGGDKRWLRNATKAI